MTYWRSFSSAPHRVFFFAGAVQAALALLFWLHQLAAPAGVAALPGAWLHAWLMLYGLFPWFILGFMMTAMPNWLGERAIPRTAFLPAWGLMAAGSLTFYPAAFVGAGAAATAAALHLAGWALGLRALWRMWRASRHPDKRHFGIALAIIGVGIGGGALLAVAWTSGSAAGVAAARSAGIWLFLLPTFFSLSHRVIPMFSAWALDDYVMVRPLWMLWAMTLLCALHAALEIAGATAWLWLADAPLAAMAGWLSWRWQLRRSLQNPLLAMLHLGFAWLPLALALYAAHSLAQLAGAGWWLGNAPLHALGVGYFGSMLLAMATRVTLAHAGRPGRAEGLMWGVFGLFQAAASGRVLADLPGTAADWRLPLYLVSGAIWLACWLVWLARHGPILLRPREDGRAG